MALRMATAPEGEIISIDEAKLYLRVDAGDQDAVVDGLITAARVHFEGPEGGLNCLFVEQTWDLLLDSFYGGHHHHHHRDHDDSHHHHHTHGNILIPLTPVQSVVSVTYYDENGDEQTVDPANYYLDSVSKPAWLLPVSGFTWPTTLHAANAVAVRFIGGHAPGTESESGISTAGVNVPATIKTAMKMLVAHWYENRGVISNGLVSDGQGNPLEVPFSVRALMNRYRMFL